MPFFLGEPESIRVLKVYFYFFLKAFFFEMILILKRQKKRGFQEKDSWGFSKKSVKILKIP